VSSSPSLTGAEGVVPSGATPTHAPAETWHLVVSDERVLILSAECQCGNPWCGWATNVYLREPGSTDLASHVIFQPDPRP